MTALGVPVVTLVSVCLPNGVHATPTRYASRTRLRGVVDAEVLSLRAVVAQNDRIGELLYQRYIEPVHGRSGIADVLLDSVRTYLDQRRSMPAAAWELTVHVNTLRYRIERFETIIGTSLDETMTALEVWWALQYATIRRPPQS